MEAGSGNNNLYNENSVECQCFCRRTTYRKEGQFLGRTKSFVYILFFSKNIVLENVFLPLIGLVFS